jgi:hypothetical protein
MSTRSFDGCIGRALKLARRIHPDQRYTMNEVASHLMAMPDARPYLNHFQFTAATAEIRKFIYDKKRVGRINGQSLEDLPAIVCGPGNRWGYMDDFNREEMEAILARRRTKQKGFDPQCVAMETLIAAMPTPKTLVGEVLE